MSTNRPASPRPASARRPTGGRKPPGTRPPPGIAEPPGGQASSARRTAEQRSAVPLTYLRHLPSWLVPVVLAALLVAGLAVRGWFGAIALCVLAAFLGWLAYLSWPRLAGPGRLGRAVAIAFLLGLAALMATR